MNAIIRHSPIYAEEMNAIANAMQALRQLRFHYDYQSPDTVCDIDQSIANLAARMKIITDPEFMATEALRLNEELKRK